MEASGWQYPPTAVHSAEGGGGGIHDVGRALGSAGQGHARAYERHLLTRLPMQCHNVCMTDAPSLLGPLITCSGWHPSYPLNFPLPKGKWGAMRENGGNGGKWGKCRGNGGGRWYPPPLVSNEQFDPNLIRSDRECSLDTPFGAHDNIVKRR